MYDVIVVGGRCAGAPTAMLMASQGHRVLMLDKDPPASDMAHSTHILQPIAIAKLRKWGILPALEAVCPSFEYYSLDLGPAVVRGKPPPVDGDARVFAPRRHVIDAIVANTAVAAGVEYRAETKVVDLIRDGNTVAGVKAVGATGGTESIAARLVIGADGPSSVVAKLVAAARYHEAPAQQATVWGYWNGIPVRELQLTIRPGRAVYACPTSGGDAMIGVNWVIDDFSAARADIARAYHAVIQELTPELAALIARSTLSTPLRIGSTRNFLRVPYGAGWALVGDAGHKKDSCTAQGITEPDGLRAWHLARDARLIPLHELTVQMAKFAAPDAAETALYRALAGNPNATTRFLGLISGSTSPAEFFAPEHIEAITGTDA